MNIRELITRWRDSRRKEKAFRLIEESREIFQLQEYDAQIWLTYRGALICPTTMLKHDAIESVNAMRTMYFDRNKDDEGEN